MRSCSSKVNHPVSRVYLPSASSRLRRRSPRSVGNPEGEARHEVRGCAPTGCTTPPASRPSRGGAAPRPRAWRVRTCARGFVAARCAGPRGSRGTSPARSSPRHRRWSRRCRDSWGRLGRRRRATVRQPDRAEDGARGRRRPARHKGTGPGGHVVRRDAEAAVAAGATTPPGDAPSSAVTHGTVLAGASSATFSVFLQTQRPGARSMR